MTGDIRVLAGPRFDALRVNFLDSFAVDQRFMKLAVMVRALTETQPERLRSASRSIQWPARMAPYEPLYAEILQGKSRSPIGWRHSKSDPHNFFGLNRKELGATGTVSSGQKLVVLQSIEDGPGHIEIRSPDHPASHIHPILMDLSATWIWGFSSVLEAASAATLWWQAAGVLSARANDALNDPELHKVTRVDVCIDHQCIESPWRHQDAKPEHWVTRSQIHGALELQTHVVDQSGLTIYIGKRGGSGVYTRIYNKTAELGEGLDKATPPKIWRRNGWDEQQPVWRCEFEFGSQALARIRRGHGTGNCLQALVAGDLYAEAFIRLRHLEEEGIDKISSKWLALSQAGPDPEPYLRNQDERRRCELMVSLRQLHKSLDRCLDAGVEQRVVQFAVDERWTKNEDQDEDERSS